MRCCLGARQGRPERGPGAEALALAAMPVGAMVTLPIGGKLDPIEEIREHGVDGFEIEVIGTDPNVDRRLASVVEIEIPHYAGSIFRSPAPISAGGGNGATASQTGPLPHAGPQLPEPPAITKISLGTTSKSRSLSTTFVP